MTMLSTTPHMITVALPSSWVAFWLLRSIWPALWCVWAI
jgi:hypothetical protein